VAVLQTLRSFSSGAASGDGSPGPPPLQDGDRLAPGYTVVGHLRRGRRLDVYDVWSEDLGARCVAKTLRPDEVDDGGARRALRRESRLLQRLAHPHLVRSFGRTRTIAQGAPVLLLETLTGHTVGYLIDEHGSIPPADVAILGIQLGSVLGFIHRHGWLHLDVKPSNVVATGGRAVLIDLSLASHTGRASGAGTFDYLSPEQAGSKPLSEAADVWGLGATLYEAMSGVTPYEEWPDDSRHSDGSPRYPQCEVTPAPLSSRGDFPTRLGTLIDGCLNLSPDLRPGIDHVVSNLADWVGVDPRRAGAES
jgi:eukaryotic-like serine/threonine-protein kinase